MITSTANSQIKNIIQLQNKAKVRNKQNSFIVEGIRMFKEVPLNDVIKVYVSESFYNKSENEIKQKINSLDYEIVDDEVFKKISDTITPQGIMVIVKQKNITIEDILKLNKENNKFINTEIINKEANNTYIIEEKNNDNSLYIILEDIQDPGNLGTIMRTAEAAGVTGVIMSKKTVDIYNSKVVRSTMGSIFRVPFLYVEDLEGTIELLIKNGVTVYAAHLKGTAQYYEKDYNKSSAFLLGNEGNGLSDKIADKAQEYIKIPMMGKVESLNVASAATILMYEALRQKQTI